MSKVSPGVLAPPHEVLTPDEWRPGAASYARLTPASSHAQWVPPADRPDPMDILEEQARTRVPDLIPIRYGRMAASPFAYFRGAAAPMAWDLAHTPTTGIRVQACGDAHLLNFGMFASPDRRLVFDVNDFDETLPAPFDWDLKRLAASFAVAARDKGFSDHDAHTAARLAVHSYRTEMARYASMRFLRSGTPGSISTRSPGCSTRSSRRRRCAAAIRHRQSAPPHQSQGVPEDVRRGRRPVPHPAGPSGDRPLSHRALPGRPGGTAARRRAVPGHPGRRTGARCCAATTSATSRAR